MRHYLWRNACDGVEEWVAARIQLSKSNSGSLATDAPSGIAVMHSVELLSSSTPREEHSLRKTRSRSRMALRVNRTSRVNPFAKDAQGKRKLEQSWSNGSR